MAICKDPLRTYLNDQGYNVVLLPRQGIEPMDVLGKDGDSVENLGPLEAIWSSTAPLPKVGPPALVTDVMGMKTASLDLNIGLNFLSSVLGAMGQGNRAINSLS